MPQAGHHAIITGGEGSIGQAVAQVLLDRAWTVDQPGSGELDVRQEALVRSYFKDREVDLLVCTAGITRDAPLIKLGEVAWDEVWEVNFQGALHCAEAALVEMIRMGSGHIVFLSSFSAMHPPVGQAAYASAKAALLGLTADLAIRHGPSNIRVNTVLPGFLETRMTECVTVRRRQEVLENHALGRFNSCREVAEFIRFLHEGLPHTSGQVFQLDSRVNFP